MSERWLPVVGYEGLYEVSDLGRVRSLVRYLRGGRGAPLRAYGGGILAQNPRGGGYPGVSLSKDGKVVTRLVHILVCTAFYGPKPADKDVVAHNDGDPANPKASNLRWATHQENEADKIRHGTKLLGEDTNNVKLTEPEVLLIRTMSGSIDKLAPIFGVDRTTIADVRSRRTWRHVA